jgi:hypothetical protein
MIEPKTVILAGKELAVPALPIRLNMKAYFICKDLTAAEYPERYVEALKSNKMVEVSEEEFASLTELAFLGACAADPALDRATFDTWTITPPELVDAFFPIRYQTGGWVPMPNSSDAPQEGQEEPGEAQGAETPRT